ncbi:MAG: hypothetical protein AUK47_05430 [Deltaproteobacteria bacterium CG2_30_63_29]|nr:MAG: hypothetical protein AUK47_05430 [Deltaproteobacteria bacterium CG2_30_63_29]PIW02529.1 MAG: hypothetical protein COW42_01190 [Deltaproteobacteria bacterium CG17_big_fil_post_rev_8_21_14_2_50_63_7]
MKSSAILFSLLGLLCFSWGCDDSGGSKDPDAQCQGTQCGGDTDTVFDIVADVEGNDTTTVADTQVDTAPDLVPDLPNCGSPCVTGSTCCENAIGGFECFDLDSDASNCGACGTTCESGACCGAACGAVGGDLLCCDSHWTDVKASGEHCGQCGTSCGANGLCLDSACVPEFVFESTGLSTGTATIPAGGSVAFTNGTLTDTHQALFDDVALGSTEVLAPGAQQLLTFPTAGGYSFRCGVHPTRLVEAGLVIVQ